MNTRLIGKIVIGIGVLMLLAYIGWIVFRVVKQPDEVAQNGLLPNPYDLVVPRPRPDTSTPSISVGNDSGDTTTVVEIPTSPDKRLFRISQSPAVSFTQFQTVDTQTTTNPLTGLQEKNPTTKTIIRYVTRDEGFVQDAVIENNEVKEQRTSNAFVSNIYTSDISRYVAVGQYRSGGGSTSTAYSLILEKPPKIAQETIVPKQQKKACKYNLVGTKVGDVGPSVESLQQVLAAAGFADTYQVGIFEDKVTRSLLNYQKQKKITPVSGIIDAKTLSQLINDCAELLPLQPEIETRTQQIAREQAAIQVLPKGIYKASLLDDTHIFMLLNSGGKNRGVIRDASTGIEKEIYSMGFVDWSASLLGTDNVLATTTPSGAVPGYALSISKLTNLITPVLSALEGLATLPSPDGKQILYSTTEGGLPSLSLYTVVTRATTNIAMQTFAEKCTWTSDSTSIYCMVPAYLPDGYVYPDEWYKRGINISDEPKTYTIGGRVESLDTEGEIAAINVDAIESAVSEGKEYYIFRDWKSGYIWGYRLK